MSVGWFLLILLVVYVLSPEKKRSPSSEKRWIQRQLKEGWTILQIAQKCKHHNQDDILSIKHEMWNNGWENY